MYFHGLTKFPTEKKKGISGQDPLDRSDVAWESNHFFSLHSSNILALE